MYLITNFGSDYENHKFEINPNSEKEDSSDRKLHIKYSNISVHQELKYAKRPDAAFIDVFNDWCRDIDISHCEKIWIDMENITADVFEKFGKDESLKKLFVTVDGIYFDSNYGILKLDSSTLESLIINCRSIDYQNDDLHNFDFTGCPNLRIFSFGNNTQIESLNGLNGLNQLKVLAFGDFLYSNVFEMLKEFEQKERELLESYSTDDKRLPYQKSSIIHDLSGIMGSNIEFLNISMLHHISSEQFYEVVRSLPNLKEIIGEEINNAEMCSPELMQYCMKHNIKTPFTEKSLAIKKRLKQIVSDSISPDMNEFQKVLELSKYVIGHTEYYNAPLDSDCTPEEIKIAWGENLWFTTMEGKGLCAGYAEFTQALFTEAGISCYIQPIRGHVFNLVEINGDYFQIDLTNLDSYLSKKHINLEDYSFDINSLFYMVPLDENSPLPYIEPYGARQYRYSTYNSNQSKEQEDSKQQQEISKPDESKHRMKNCSTMQIIIILLGLGIARKISKENVLEIQEMASPFKSPFWSLKSLKKLYRRLRGSNEPKFGDTGLDR